MHQWKETYLKGKRSGLKCRRSYRRMSILFQIANALKDINISMLNYLLCGATVLVELWPPHIFYVRFRDNKFLQGGLSAPRLTPNLKDQGISLSLAPPSKPVRYGWSYQQLCCRRHSFRVHWGIQAPLTQQQSAFNKLQITSRGNISIRL
jgi:hypothetical protein